MKANCARCGCELHRVAYVEPDWAGQSLKEPRPRPPLCKACWEKADQAARAAQPSH